ncbi:ubiquinol-cytochrome c reductase core subunit 1 [Lobosporangium transversale]|uniref:Cytochrome b-c1 complex subunit 2, mitochondrial n=1 Tax=Lobosporangium transversale TaxID=64571 RepID=A0A1Y2H4X4_9FUNG|nr:Metalloenzyme, LuxS/M16 peptidase-like protein [Lobosporangium transversale]KAF9918699.1 ubiquinol-cytochrome c reductase core subunit 1 [Lobosporangium transversale]ORZ28763.1 Metalloenzyme, LuxS/M16 peptidase-like protein [Lobosporangium transversale]|eukprot:XP_021886436.1 Metalloenzyme, LuxS/M16 peptidase-like protein [Lobosporangium transversale]
MLSISSARKTINLVPTLLKAGYATAISKTSNGVKVAALDESSPTASVSLVINAGARFEPKGKSGIAHFAKNFGFKNTGKRSAFRITRETELVGGVLSSNLGRENISFTAECLKEDVPYFVEVFGDLVAQTKYTDHELHAVAKEIAAECSVAESSPEVAVVEAIHNAAFRNGLGNPIFAAPYSDITSSDLKKFAADNFVANKLALVATGISEEELKGLAASAFANVASGSATNIETTKYYGGEIRVPHNSSIAHIAIAFQGAAAGTSEFYTAQVLRSLLGGDRFVKWSTAGVSPLAAAASQIGHGAQISAFNFGYSDAGLFGVYAQAEHSSVSEAAKAAISSLKAASKSITAEEFKRALAQAKFETASRFESRASTNEILGAQAFQDHKITTIDALDAFDKVQAGDVSKFAAKLLSSKPTTVVLGKTSELPYGDALF